MRRWPVPPERAEPRGARLPCASLWERGKKTKGPASRPGGAFLPAGGRDRLRRRLRAVAVLVAGAGALAVAGARAGALAAVAAMAAAAAAAADEFQFVDVQCSHGLSPCGALNRGAGAHESQNIIAKTMGWNSASRNETG